MKKKVIVPVLLIISFVMSFISSCMKANRAVLKYDWCNSIGEYFKESGELMTLIVTALITVYIIFSIYSQKRILSKVLLIIAFFIYGGVYTWMLTTFLSYASKYILKDLYTVLRFLSYLAPVILAVSIIIDSLANCRIIKVLRIVIPIAGCCVLSLYVYTAKLHPSDYRVLHYMSGVASLLLWLGLSVWVWFHRKPISSVDETSIENFL